MRTTHVGVLVGALGRNPVSPFVKEALVGVAWLALVCSCGSDKPAEPPGPPATSEETQGATADGGDDGGAPDASKAGVECTHPGAGKPLGADRCECTTALSVAGEWTTKRTCREGDDCPTRDKEEVVVITQEGTSLQLDRGEGYTVKGTLCGTIAAWSGGPKDGLNPECGLLRFSDDSHYLTDSCFVGSGQCSRTHAQGCPSQKGQCTGTGAKNPAAPASIQKVICN